MFFLRMHVLKQTIQIHVITTMNIDRDYMLRNHTTRNKSFLGKWRWIKSTEITLEKGIPGGVTLGFRLEGSGDGGGWRPLWILRADDRKADDGHGFVLTGNKPFPIVFTAAVGTRRESQGGIHRGPLSNLRRM